MTVANGPFTRRRLARAITSLENSIHNTLSPGQTFYVCSAVSGASDSNAGTDPTAPLATLDAAINKCTASKGDVIIIGPGHTENITGATSVVVDIAGISIIGVGNGRLRPKFTYTATGSNIPISAANVLIKNIVFDLTGIDAVVAGFTITTADVAFEDCEFVTNSAAAGCVQCIVTAATADRLRVEDCRFLGPATNSGTTTTAQIDHEAGVDYVIHGCYFTGKMTQAITNGAAVLRGLIDNNRFVIATGTKAINMHASSTPFVSNNRINVPSGTAPIVCAAGFMAGNVYSAAAGVTAGTASTF